MKSKNVRRFFASMVVTFCVVTLFLGIITVDYNTRWVGFGNDMPIACITTTQQGTKQVEINTMGIKQAVDITAGYKAVKWTKQSAGEVAQWAEQSVKQAEKWAQIIAEWVTVVYNEICKIWVYLFK